MTAPTTPRVSVPVEELKQIESKLRPKGWIMTAEHVRAMLAAAPVREEGGAALTTALTETLGVLDVCLEFAHTSYGAKLVLDGKAAAKIERAREALATREEAPAEAGEDAKDGTLVDALFGHFQKVYGFDTKEAWESTEEIIAIIDRAHPQAREEAQPVAWMMRQRDGHMWAYSDDAEDARLATADGFQVRPLYTTPPAQEAEKLRLALEEAADAVDFFDRVKAATGAERTAVGSDHWKRMEAALRALAALQQEGRE